MRFTVSVDVSGITRKLDILVRDLREFDEKVLKPFSKEKREEVQERFASGGPGWEPRGERAAQRAAQRMVEAGGKGAATLRKKLNREIKRAIKSRDRRFIKSAAGKRAKVYEGATRAIGRREQALAVFERVIAGGEFSGREARVAEKIRERLDRAETRAQKTGRLLGKISQSISATVSGGKLTLESSIPWAGVHNEGGSGGNNAEIPKRTFLEWTDKDIDRVVTLSRDQMLLAFE